MRSSVRQRSLLDQPGLTGVARVDRRPRALLPRLVNGDIAVIDHLDLDRTTAQALVDAGVSAVIDAAPIISGRFPNLGPSTLVEAGVLIVDSVGAGTLSAIRDGARIRIHESTVYLDDADVTVIAEGRVLDREAVQEEMDKARSGLVTHLSTFTHNSAEFLRREQDLLLHGIGVPRLATRIMGRPVVVVGREYDVSAELQAIRPFLREQNPVLIGIGTGADLLRASGLRPDVVVIDAAEFDDLPSAAALKAATDVVVRLEGGASQSPAGSADLSQLERLGLRPLRFESTATPEDAALLLADAGDPTVIVGVGMRATIDELLDGQRTGQAGTYLTRLKVGPRLVDATTVPYLYSGRVRPWHLLLVMLAGFLALAAAIAVTPVGQEWADSFGSWLADTFDSLQGRIS